MSKYDKNFTYRIHYTLPDGSNDSLVLETDTIEELQEQAAHEVTKRNATDFWSEPL